MLEALATLAARLRPASPFFAGAAALLLIAAAALVLLDPTGQWDQWLSLVLMLLLWCVCVWIFIRIFATVPPPPSTDLRGLARLRAALNRAFHWLLAAVFAGLTVAVVLLTIRIGGELTG